MKEKSKWHFVVSLYVAAFLLLLLSFFPAPRLLLWGWVLFLVKTVPLIESDWGTALLAFLATLLFAVGVHWGGKRAVIFYHRKDSEKTYACWSIRSTFSFVSLLFLLFIAGISMVGVTHQAIWLYGSSEPKYKSSLDNWGDTTKNSLKRIGIALHNYHDMFDSFPYGGTYDETGAGMSNWISSISFLLPVSFPEQYDKSLSWNHPQNKKYYQCILPDLTNTELTDAPIINSEGYGLAHYAANSRVMGGNKTFAFEDISDGTANTLFIGEVNANFLPWGHPLNMRDPTNGINKSPRGFGGPPQRKGALFLMADGRVKLINENIAPEILRALSTPNGNETYDISTLNE